MFVVLLALAVLITLTRNWNAWEGDKVEQVTDDAYVRGDLTPLSTIESILRFDLRSSFLVAPVQIWAFFWHMLSSAMSTISVPS